MLPLFVAIEAKNIPACLELLQHYTEQQLRHRRQVISPSSSLHHITSVMIKVMPRHR